MFPIPWNFPFRKKDGSLSIISAEMGGVLPPATASKLGGVKVGSGLSVTSDGTLSGDNELPAHTIATAGKVLTVGDNGDVEWGNVDGFSGYGVYAPYLLPYPMFKPSSNSGKYNIGTCSPPTSSTTTRTFQTGDYNLGDCFIGDAASYHEFYNYLTSDVINGLNMELLYDGKSEAVATAELLDTVTDYDFLVLQGCYDTTGTSQYDTTIIYSNIDLDHSYWFGVKDRNNSYGGVLTFTDATHISLSPSRRIKIYGIKSE